MRKSISVRATASAKTMHQFPEAAGTTCPKLGGLKEQKCVLSEFQMPEV